MHTNDIIEHNNDGDAVAIVSALSPDQNAMPPYVVDNGRPDRTTESNLPQDLIPRPRDRRGNRYAQTFPISVPVMDDVPIEQTYLSEVCRRLDNFVPSAATTIRSCYNDRLRPAIRRAIAVREEEEKSRVKSNQEAVTFNHDLDSKIAGAWSEGEKEIENYNNTLNTRAEDLHAAHLKAADELGALGQRYDPQHSPANEGDMGVRNDMESISARAELPWPAGDYEALLEARMFWAATALVGAIIGISLGIVANFLQADAIQRKPFVLLGCISGGAGAAFLGGSAIKLSFRQVGELSALGVSFIYRIPAYLIATCVAAAVLITDSLLEKEGLLSFMRLRDQTAVLSGTPQVGDAGRQITYFLVGILVTFGYVVCSAWVGYLTGRCRVIMNKITALSRPSTGHEGTLSEAAIASLAKVSIARQRLADAQRSLEEIRHAQKERIRSLEVQRKPVQDRLSSAACMRIQDALDNLQICQSLFDYTVADALSRLPEGNSLFYIANRVTRQLRGHRPKSLRQRLYNWLWLADSRPSIHFQRGMPASETPTADETSERQRPSN